MCERLSERTDTMSYIIYCVNTLWKEKDFDEKSTISGAAKTVEFSWI